jgi:hypothetical protein
VGIGSFGPSPTRALSWSSKISILSDSAYRIQRPYGGRPKDSGTL